MPKCIITKHTNLKSCLIRNQTAFLILNPNCCPEDHTALPIICVMIAAMQENAIAEVYIEIPSPDDLMELKHPANVKLNRIFNPTPGITSKLPELVRTTEFPNQGTKFLFAAAES